MAAARVLHLGKFFPPAHGGIESFLLDLCRAQQRLGLDARALVHRHESWRPAKEETAQGVPVLRSPCLGSVVYAPVAPLFGLHLQRLLRRFRPHVLHVHVPNTSAFWALAPGMPGNAPLVVHWHADVVPSAIDRRLALLYNGYRVLERRLLDRSARIVATSHPYLEHSAPLRPHRDKCRIVPLGLDPERLAAVTPDTPPPGAASVLERAGSRPLVMALGRLTYYKGFDVLLRAAAEVPDACFAVVGQGPLLGRLQEQARALGVEDRVVLAGGLPDADVHCLLSRCAAFCLPSVERTEAFGVVLLEAMFHGRPLVSTAIPGSGVGVVNKEGESGLHVPVGDPAALAAALRTLLGDEALRRRLGRGARQRLAQRFGMEPVARGVQAVYDEAVSPKSW